ncbi:MAG: hypothetical protein A3E23_14075 [Burkholderiales bacterium RIFCSPHIGHO2_12_FULL_65_48]|nr:MAG: hypothetical protein A3C40_23155 [Burkholderiales bacterium RIFCSPHIGHO2_02_FULL_64_19]OGB25479.1 MAG: hypothetical protein A3E23_14075 [Burkholderiales bacterium RIFCSPHIGHO2_12_FULL_65_48]OGB58802.1 MAG: hypothetical protein A3F71_23100 [Burkholderiales bacterium RIFCSPLOWO2_12_FULL_64_33]
MEFGWEWILSVVAGSAGGGALVLIAGYLGKAQLSHWLTKDLEALKAKHQRDLEAYKISLIAEAERAKASQEVRKAMAVKIAEKKFAALDALHKVLDPQAVQVLSLLRVESTLDRSERMGRIKELSDKSAELSVAARMAAPFMSIEDLKVLSEYASSISYLLARLAQNQLDTEPEGHTEHVARLMKMQIAADQVVRAHLDAMLAMT